MFLATSEILNDKEAQINSFSMRTVLVASLLLIVMLVVAGKVMGKHPKIKLPLFVLIASAVLVPTTILFGSTIYLNTSSDSGGPIHWHTDVEFWACGAELELRDPTGFLSNKIGSPTFHEHNDKRLHLEGVVVDKEYDASLEKFMLLAGGKISKERLLFPLNENQDEWFAVGEKTDGDQQHLENFSLATGAGEWITNSEDGPVLNLDAGKVCSGANEMPAEVQAFVYRYNKTDDTYSQEKLADPARYVLRDESTVPPGDCLIIEYDSPKDRTDKLCEQYGVRDQSRCTQFGVDQPSPKLCKIREVSTGQGGYN